MTSRRLVPIAAALLVGVAAAALLLTRGHGKHAEAPPAQPQPPPAQTQPQKHQPAPRAPFSWPVYGFDAARTHLAPLPLRPPFRILWRTFTDSSFIEFPPVLARGRLFLGTNHGLVLGVDARSGRIAWHRQFAGCVAASPAVGNGIVYVGFMDPPPCKGTDPSFLAALDARNGRTLWRFRAGVIESPPLLVANRVFFGSWDHRVYSLDARTGRPLWSFSTGDRVKSGVAYARGTIVAGSYDGYLYALDARSGRLRWTAGGGGLGGLYATPSVADGRVLVGSTDGRVYAFSLADGTELWSARTGSYVYSPAALAGATAYVGSYDHRLYALSQATGRIRWTFDAGAPISGAPTVLGGLVYFSTCGSCSSYESNPRARRTFAVDARSGRLVWRFPDGEYSPVIADRERLYLAGFTILYGLAPRG
jgi:outer membrane protein assembly factor BamB